MYIWACGCNSNSQWPWFGARYWFNHHWLAYLSSILRNPLLQITLSLRIKRNWGAVVPYILCLRNFLRMQFRKKYLNSARRVRKPSMISKTSMSVLWKRDLQSQVMKSVLLRWNWTPETCTQKLRQNRIPLRYKSVPSRQKARPSKHNSIQSRQIFGPCFSKGR